MCGVLAYAGSTSFDANPSLDALAHRGPDHAAISHEGNVVFGHRRLSIIDVDAKSDQPMTSASGKTAIVFNGEIYNYKELREELQREGIVFRTNGDTEVLLEGYEKHGAEFFDRMRGMWAFVIHDVRSNSLLLARDPFGIKPLIYSVQQGSIYAASEIRCLKSVLTLEPDPESYAAFYNLGYFIAPRTPYKGVSRLRPGEVLQWDISSKTLSPVLQTSRYMGNTPSLSAHTAYDVLDAAVTNSVEAHYVADVPVAMLLSGGTDSSLLAALSKKLGKNPTAYHVAIAGSKDTVYAKSIAQHLGIDLVVKELTQDALQNQYEKVWDILDEPTGDISIIPTSLVFEYIKGSAKVVLSGEGGDELFGGYLRHKMLSRHQSVTETHWSNTFFNSLLQKRGGYAINTPVIERLRMQVLGSGMVNDLVGAYLASTRLMQVPIDDALVREQLTTLFQSEYDDRMSDTLAFDVLSYLPNDLLPKSDIAAMASSIEARVPLVDRSLAVTASAVHAALGAPTGDKCALKEVLARYIPRELAFRGKSGFGVPMHAYDSKTFIADFHAACDFHLDHGEAFGVSASMRAVIGTQSARETIARKFPRFAFALISNWKVVA